MEISSRKSPRLGIPSTARCSWLVGFWYKAGSMARVFAGVDDG